ncbi:MAG TPA: LytTR family DNA-binding domain-containing protein [Bacteroidales bacterium]|nr:LytTR family DNA-binding domain-containing protein [Bacteroidales bacterium]
MKIKCVIIDDEPIAREIIREYISKLNELEIIAEFKKATEAISFLNENKTDLLFLDINMPEINGIDFARSLSNPPAIIFTTAYREFAADGFELQAIDYLVKPIPFDRFLKAVNHYFKLHSKSVEMTTAEISGRPEEEFILLKDSKKTHKVFLTDIKYIESDGDYIRFYLQSRKLLVRGSLSSMEVTLPPTLFLRIHNSYMINLKKVNALTLYSVEIDGTELPISRSHKEKVLKILNIKPY